MNCRNCGAPLRKIDKFCSQCGARVEDLPFERTPAERAELDFLNDTAGDIPIKEVRTFEHGKFRDSFLEKQEDHSKALTVTVAILLVIAVVAMAFAGAFFLMGQLKRQENNTARHGTTSPDGITIFDEAVTEEESESQQAAIVIADPAAVQTETTAQTETAAQTETNAQTESETQKSGVLDVNEIERIVTTESTASSYGIYIYDENSNSETRAGGADEPMFASACISIPILYTAAWELDAGMITLNDQITYVNSIGGRGEAYPEERDGQSFPLSYYLTTMLTYSDNNCMNCLIDFLTLEMINNTCRNAGYNSVDLQRKIVADVTDGSENYISAADLGGMARELYNGKFSLIGRDFMKQYFMVDQYDENRTMIGLAPSVSAGNVTMFLNQNGKGDTRYSEVALISTATDTVLISVMLGGDYGFTYDQAIADVTDYCLQSLNMA